MTRHKAAAGKHLEDNYESFFSQYNKLLESDNLVTRLTSLQLLNELLHDRNNLRVMKRFINSEDNLKMIMNKMLDSHRGVQLVGFNVFQIFIAHPDKSEPVQQLLINNRTLLIRFLENFSVKNNEERFAGDKITILVFITITHKDHFTLETQNHENSSYSKIFSVFTTVVHRTYANKNKIGR